MKADIVYIMVRYYLLGLSIRIMVHGSLGYDVKTHRSPAVSGQTGGKGNEAGKSALLIVVGVGKVYNI